MDRMDGLDRLDRMDGLDEMDGLDRMDGMDGLDGLDRMDGMDGMDRMDRMDRLDGLDRIDGLDWMDGIVLLKKKFWHVYIEGLGFFLLFFSANVGLMILHVFCCCLGMNGVMGSCFSFGGFSGYRKFIKCDKCGKWFHPRCVGLTTKSSDALSTYVCPPCQKNASHEAFLRRRLSGDDVKILQGVIADIKKNRNSGAFMEPVDPIHAPGYYTAIAEPMG